MGTTAVQYLHVRRALFNVDIRPIGRQRQTKDKTLYGTPKWTLPLTNS